MCRGFMPAGRFGRLDETDPWSFSSIELHTFLKLKSQLDENENFPNCFKRI